MKHKICRKYKALGFVEALIAIAVTGIAAIVLMGLAINTLNQVMKNEREDEMMQVAIEGGSAVRSIAQKNNDSEEILFPTISQNINNCFELSTSTSNPEFVKDGENFRVVCNYSAGGRENCKSALAPNYEDVFRVFCITNGSSASTNLVVGKVIVGKTICEDSQSCDISDYSYYTIVRTKQL